MKTILIKYFKKQPYKLVLIKKDVITMSSKSIFHNLCHYSKLFVGLRFKHFSKVHKSIIWRLFPEGGNQKIHRSNRHSCVSCIGMAGVDIRQALKLIYFILREEDLETSN